MSQPQNPTDAQALVESMLERLKLQTGRDSQAYLHAPAAITPVPACRQDAEEGASIVWKVNSSPSRDSSQNGVASEEISASVDAGKDEMNGDLISREQKDDVDGAALSQATLAGSFPTGTSRLLPAGSLKDADAASFEKTNGERVSSGSSAGDAHVASSAGPNQGPNQSFASRDFVWSLRSSDADAGARGGQLLHVGNGGLEAPTATNGSFRTKQRPSEKKAKLRWTAKIRERFRDRQGSRGKKGKDDGGTASNESMIQNERLTGDPFQNDAGAVLPPLDAPSEMSAHHEDNPVDGLFRPALASDFGLGSFSLMEEITKGQEWALFFQPDAFPASAKLNDGRPLAFGQMHSGSSQWSWGDVQPRRVVGGSGASPAAAVGMEVSGGGPTETERSEVMEDGRNPSDTRPTERRALSSPLESQPSESGAVARNRSQLTRKRHHQSAEMLQPERMSEGEEADPAGAFERSGQEMEETEAWQPVSFTSSSHPPPLPHSTVDPSSPPPRGVLKNSISQSSMETLSKRRRLDNRQVRFSEEVVVIVAPEPDLDFPISEADSEEEEEEEEEEDCFLEQEEEEEHVVVEEMAPARQPVLAQWLLALVGKNPWKRPR